jgi:hypothetical protein
LSPRCLYVSDRKHCKKELRNPGDWRRVCPNFMNQKLFRRKICWKTKKFGVGGCVSMSNIRHFDGLSAALAATSSDRCEVEAIKLEKKTAR